MIDMSNPKEKANELVVKFTVVGLQQRNEGIQCALICVDEIMHVIDWHEFETPNEELNYWNQVKAEINKL
jgi:hypothetical protein